MDTSECSELSSSIDTMSQQEEDIIYSASPEDSSKPESLLAEEFDNFTASPNMDMAPVTFRSKIPELQLQVDKRVLACLDLTWQEYIEMLSGFELNSEEHVVKGTAGRELNINAKIGDYIGSFKRRQKVHPISIDLKPTKRISFNSKKIKSHSSCVEAEFEIALKAIPTNGEIRASEVEQSPLAPIRIKKRRGSPRRKKRRESKSDRSKKSKTIVSLTEVPQDFYVISSDISLGTLNESRDLSMEQEKSLPAVATVSTGTQIKNTPAPIPKPVRNSESLSSSSEFVPKLRKDEGLFESNNKFQQREMMPPPPIPLPKNAFYNHPLPGHMHPSSVGMEGYYLYPPHPQGWNLNGRYMDQFFHPSSGLQNGSNMFAPNHSANEDSLEGGSSDDESIIARRCPPQPLPNMKPTVVNFLSNKVSNKDLLKVREELMKLKDSDDYFKMTSLVPMAAGLLEQMLCRALPH